MNTPRKLAGKTVIVTGASKGIGAAVSRALAAEGAAVVVNYSSSKAGADQVVSDIVAGGGRAVAVQADISRQADIERLFSEAQKAFGQIDGLINNAGRYELGPIGSITEESFHRHFNLNVLGVLLASQEAVKYFPAIGGVIVNISSVVALVTPPGIAVYNASKGAVDAITRSFARELADRKIRVNAINPGLVATEGTHATGLVVDGAETSPLGPVAKAEDIAAIVVFLASDDSRWINGHLHYATGRLL